MTAVVFSDRSNEPTDRALEAALGPAVGAWREIERRVVELGGTPGWTYGGAKYGWTLRLQGRKRAILYLTPAEACFRAGIALPDAARAAALTSDLPRSVLEQIRASKRYPEGWAVRMEVRTAEDVMAVLRLARLKVEAG